MTELIAASFYLLLPAYAANMAPVIVGRLGWLKNWNQPLDNNKTWRGRPLLGRNKTWRGVAAAVLAGCLVSGLQARLFDLTFFNRLSLLNYDNYWLAFGVLAGWGAIMGDAVKSFFKRRLGLPPGEAWPVFDQLDFVIGFFALSWPFLSAWSWPIFLVGLLLTLLLHPLVNLTAYIFKIKKVWW